jgi:xylulokinase
MAVLGLDLGTSAVKALVLSDDGDVLAVASAPCGLDAPRPGWAEADPGSWLEAAGTAVRRALAAAGGGEPLRAIGLAGQMHGVVLGDDRGRPLRPALLWPDRRATAELSHWRGLARERRAALGNPLVPGMAGPLLAWLAREEPDAIARAAWALQPKDWLRLQLTGEAATEPTDASATLLWDLPADGWAADVAEAAGIPARLLAPLRASRDAAGALRAPAAAALGLPAGLPVHVGAADAAAALLGAGMTRAGRRLLNVGTGAQLVTVVDGLRIADAPTTHRYRAVGSGWYAMAAVQNAGLALGWVRELLGVSWEAAEREAFASDGRDGDPLFLPHLTGERTPLLDPRARGAWLDLALDHRRGDLMRGAYQGVAHAIRHAREALDAEAGRGAGALRLLGGGSLRPAYRRLLADTLAEPLELLDVADATARGAAALAAGIEPEPAAGQTIEPDPAGVERAGERHERWLEAVALTSTRSRRPR